jgi:transposase
MIALPAGVKFWITGGVTDIRRGMNTLARQVQQGLGRDPYAGEIFRFRGREGDLLKILWHDGVGMSLYLKRLKADKSQKMACFCWQLLRPDGRYS